MHHVKMWAEATDTMPDDDLRPDSDALAEWEKLPQNKPSKDALPPLTGGTRWSLVLLAVVFILIIVSLLLQSRPA